MNVTLAVVATSWPIAISFALAVTPVPPITFKVRLAAIEPPPVKPVPAITLTAEWSICSLATKLVVESWSTWDEPLIAPLKIPVNALAIIVPLALIFAEPVRWPLNKWVSVVASPNIFEPSVCKIEEVTIEEVKLVTVILVTVIVAAVSEVTSISAARASESIPPSFTEMVLAVPPS